RVTSHSHESLLPIRQNNVCGIELSDVFAAYQSHHAIDFSPVDLQGAQRTRFTRTRRSMQRSAADHDGIRAQRQRLDYIASASEAAVDDHRNALSDGFYDLWQHENGSGSAVEHASAMG